MANGYTIPGMYAPHAGWDDGAFHGSKRQGLKASFYGYSSKGNELHCFCNIEFSGKDTISYSFLAMRNYAISADGLAPSALPVIFSIICATIQCKLKLIFVSILPRQ